MGNKTDRSIRWKHYLLELFVVFFGVMAAFVLSSWRESRQNDTLQYDYLRSIYTDLQQDQESLDENVQLMMDHKRMLDKFLSDPGEGWTSDSTSVVIANSLSLIEFMGKTSTYESMKFSGQLGLIDDVDLRNEIVDYYESFSTIELLEETTTYWITQNLSPFYLEKFDMATFQFIDPETVNQITFKNRMFGYSVILQQHLLIYEELRESNQQLLEYLREYFEDQ